MEELSSITVSNVTFNGQVSKIPTELKLEKVIMQITANNLTYKSLKCGYKRMFGDGFC